jgi:hypothetical protein
VQSLDAGPAREGSFCADADADIVAPSIGQGGQGRWAEPLVAIVGAVQGIQRTHPTSGPTPKSSF